MEEHSLGLFSSRANPFKEETRGNPMNGVLDLLALLYVRSPIDQVGFKGFLILVTSGLKKTYGAQTEIEGFLRESLYQLILCARRLEIWGRAFVSPVPIPRHTQT